MSQVARTTQQVGQSKGGTDAVPRVLWAPLAGGVIVLVPGLLGLALGHPWLFPSLGPTAFLQAVDPQHPSARPGATFVGHLLGAVAAFLVVLLLGAADAPSPLAGGALTSVRVWAAILAMIGTLLLQVLLGFLHPPAAATTLLVALGGFGPTWADAGTIAAGVAAVTIGGEIIRRARLAQPGQT